MTWTKARAIGALQLRNGFTKTPLGGTLRCVMLHDKGMEIGGGSEEGDEMNGVDLISGIYLGMGVDNVL